MAHNAKRTMDYAVIIGSGVVIAGCVADLVDGAPADRAHAGTHWD